MEPPEQFMEYYSIIVPTVCPLEQGSLEKIMKTMTEYSAANYVPQLWNDAVYMELVSRESAMESITAALASGSGPSASSLQENDEVDPILTTARSIWKYVETSVASYDPERRNPGLQLSVVQDEPRKHRIAHLFDFFIRWTGVVLGNLMKVFLQYGDFSAAIEAMAKTYALRSKLSNFVPVSALDLLVETCIAEKVVEPALVSFVLSLIFRADFKEINDWSARRWPSNTRPILATTKRRRGPRKLSTECSWKIPLRPNWRLCWPQPKHRKMSTLKRVTRPSNLLSSREEINASV